MIGAVASPSADLLLQRGQATNSPLRARGGSSPLLGLSLADCCTAAEVEGSCDIPKTHQGPWLLAAQHPKTWFAGSRGCARVQRSGTAGLCRGALLRPALSGDTVLGAGLSVRQRCEASSSLESACGGEAFCK